MRTIKNSLNTCGTFLAGVVGHHYLSKLLDYKSDMAAANDKSLRDEASAQNMESLQTNLKEVESTMKNLSESVDKLLDKQVPEAKLNAVFQKLEIGKQQCNTVVEILQKGPENVNLEFYRIAYRAADACARANADASATLKDLVDSLNNKSALVSNLNLDGFYTYLDSLSLLELSALYHLIVLILVISITFNIFSAILGNEIINYFKLEEKFPRLASFFRLRLKFQRYYLTICFIWLLIICFASIILNILVLY